MIPAKLEAGNEVRVVSPSVSLGFIAAEQRELAEERWRGLGLGISYSPNSEMLDRFDSSPVGARVSDLHGAFLDPEVKGMLTTLGGYNSNQLLRHLDYGLIKDNPKVLCGFSDITALATAIYARTGLVTYSGPHFTTLGMKRGIEYTIDHFERCLMREGPFGVEPADHWSDDLWYADQENRDMVPNPGYRVVNEGEAEGTIIGGNLGTLALLFGTPYMPGLEGTVLLLEDDEEIRPEHFDRTLQSLVHQPGFEGVRGILFGRFQRASNMDFETLDQILGAKPELGGIPIVADASFGHTTPAFTFPIGGTGSLRAHAGDASFRIEAH
ncbi:LD-carboxypeptidase [Rubrobacter tropicus]|uniref:LD-carboxypeptidase n=1 Tax=Rubrobacter tropicus TaxID=2653851 RepID=A0A6G8Q7Z1_9ACTN|nr:S66 peptidase family protein [Rubrobacter tropicus]QIN82552.1 LD-carboxypeptidase [Rubrobacter tropicus]